MERPLIPVHIGFLPMNKKKKALFFYVYTMFDLYIHTYSVIYRQSDTTWRSKEPKDITEYLMR